MKPTANLNRNKEFVDDGNDSIVIVNDLGDIPGGRTLDVSGFSPFVRHFRAGHIIIQLQNGEYAPMPLDGMAYDSLPSNATYVGVLKHSVTYDDPRAAIMTMGQVNAAACPFPIDSDIAEGMPNIQFLYLDQDPRQHAH